MISGDKSPATKKYSRLLRQEFRGRIPYGLQGPNQGRKEASGLPMADEQIPERHIECRGSLEFHQIFDQRRGSMGGVLPLVGLSVGSSNHQAAALKG